MTVLTIYHTSSILQTSLKSTGLPGK